MATTTIVPVFQARRGEYGCDGCDATDVPQLVLITARKKVDLMLCDGCLARREERYGRPFPAKAIYTVLSVVPREELQAAAPSRPIMLNKGASLTFELVSTDLAACTLGIVSRACDAVENQPAFSKLTILPPVEGTTRFEVCPDEDGVSVDLPSLKRALVETLEAMV